MKSHSFVAAAFLPLAPLAGPAVMAQDSSMNFFITSVGSGKGGDLSDGGNTSWNAAHESRGCSQEDLGKTGGAGLFMCFAAD